MSVKKCLLVSINMCVGQSSEENGLNQSFLINLFNAHQTVIKQQDLSAQIIPHSFLDVKFRNKT